MRNVKQKIGFAFMFISLIFIFSSVSSGAIFYPAPAFQLKEAVENGRDISFDSILKEEDTRGVMLYFMTTW